MVGLGVLEYHNKTYSNLHILCPSSMYSFYSYLEETLSNRSKGVYLLDFSRTYYKFKRKYNLGELKVLQNYEAISRQFNSLALREPQKVDMKSIYINSFIDSPYTWTADMIRILSFFRGPVYVVVPFKELIKMIKESFVYEFFDSFGTASEIELSSGQEFRILEGYN